MCRYLPRVPAAGSVGQRPQFPSSSSPFAMGIPGQPLHFSTLKPSEAALSPPQVQRSPGCAPVAEARGGLEPAGENTRTAWVGLVRARALPWVWGLASAEGFEPREKIAACGSRTTRDMGMRSVSPVGDTDLQATFR